jgi:hypothetical protein
LKALDVVDLLCGFVVADSVMRAFAAHHEPGMLSPDW